MYVGNRWVHDERRATAVHVGSVLQAVATAARSKGA